MSTPSSNPSVEVEEEEKGVKLTDHVDVSSIPHGDEQKLSTPPSSTSTRSPSFFDLRIAVVGNVDSGKSTIIGVLTGGSMDNGRGLARSRVFLHKHRERHRPYLLHLTTHHGL